MTQHEVAPVAAGSALAVFRLASWALTSFQYLLLGSERTGGVANRVGVVGFLLISAIAGTLILRRALGRPDKIMRLVLLEAALLPILMVPTGGLDSPFLWYVLNPLLVAAVYLGSRHTWGVYGIVAVLAYLAEMLNNRTWKDVLHEDGTLLISLLLVTLVIRMLTGVQRRLQAQSDRIEQQSRDLQVAYSALDARRQALSSLTAFQREAVIAEDQGALYGLLTRAAVQRFGGKWAIVLHAVPEVTADLIVCPWLPQVPGCRMVSAGEVPPFDLPWEPLWRAAEEVGRSSFAEPVEGVMVSPVLRDEGRLISVFAVGGQDPAKSGELAVLIEYAGQLAGRMIAAERITRTLDHLENVYKIVESAGATQAEHDLIELTTAYARAVSGAALAGFSVIEPDVPDAVRTVNVAQGPGAPDANAPWLYERISTWWAALVDGRPPSRESFRGPGCEWHAAYAPVRSAERRFGILYVLGDEPLTADVDVTRTLGLLGNLLGAMLQRQQVEGLHGRLLVAEEQGRIAAEIHDGASQGMFSLIYGLEGAIRSLQNGKAAQVLETLTTIRDVASTVSRELRTSIYQLAANKGEGAFVGALRAHLGGVGRLYGVETELIANGSEENVSPALRRSLYRIVREATSNGVRHGRATKVNVILTLSPVQTVLEIHDNGQGFEPPPAGFPLQRLESGKVGGMGLMSMAQLARSFDGSLRVESAPGQGCRLTVRVPDRRPKDEVGSNEASVGG